MGGEGVADCQGGSWAALGANLRGILQSSCHRAWMHLSNAIWASTAMKCQHPELDRYGAS